MYISAGAQICNKKGRHGVGGVFRKYRLSRGGWQNFCKGQIVNSPQRVKVCLERSLGTTRSLLSMHTCVINRFSSVRVHVRLWTVAHQAPLSLGFSRQEYWSGLLGPPPGDLPDLGVEPTSLTSPALAAEFLTPSPTWEPHGLCHSYSILL